MDDLVARLLENLGGRLTGPLHLRFLLQPAVAIAFAIADGLKDARQGNPPYGWSVLTVPEHRMQLVRDGWKSIGKVFLAALLIDVIYQLLVLRFVYPGEALVVGLILAIVPYSLLRGLVTRLAGKRSGPRSV